MRTELYDYNRSKRPNRTLMFSVLIFFLLFGSLGFFLKIHYSSAPKNFPVGSPIDIPEGATIKSTAQILKDHQAVYSPLLFYYALTSASSEGLVQAGTYTFTKPLNVNEIAKAITSGEYRSPHVSITLPEGFRARELRTLLPILFGEYTDERLDALDGTLFPDTYFFSSTDTANEILTTLSKMQTERLEEYREEIAQSGFTESEIIILASILEREANDLESKRIVSGILRNRLENDMPLQVDATFHYTLGKASAELTQNDLKSDSVFNTYTNKGLPPQPIANPGIRAIEAALRPIKSDYLYYLTGDDGVFYYAETFEEHKRNKDLYLR